MNSREAVAANIETSSNLTCEDGTGDLGSLVRTGLGTLAPFTTTDAQLEEERNEYQNVRYRCGLTLWRRLEKSEEKKG